MSADLCTLPELKAQTCLLLCALMCCTVSDRFLAACVTAQSTPPAPAAGEGGSGAEGRVVSDDAAALTEQNTPWAAVLGVFAAIVAFTWILLTMAL